MERFLDESTTIGAADFQNIVRTYCSNPSMYTKIMEGVGNRSDYMQIVFNICNEEVQLSSRDLFHLFNRLVTNISKFWDVENEQREEFKSFLISFINGHLETVEEASIVQMDLCLVEIAKKEWPDVWESFLTDLMGIASEGEQILKNVLRILSMIMEDISASSRDVGLTGAASSRMNAAFGEVSGQVLELIMPVISEQHGEEATIGSIFDLALNVLRGLASRIDCEEIFNQEILSMVIENFFSTALGIKVLQVIGDFITVGYVDEEQYGHLTNFYRILCESAPSVYNPEETSFSQLDETAKGLFIITFPEFIQQYGEIAESQENEDHTKVVLQLIIAATADAEEGGEFEQLIEFWSYTMKRVRLERNSRSNRLMSIYHEIFPSLMKILATRIANPIAYSEDEESGMITFSSFKIGDLYSNMKNTIVCITQIQTQPTRAIIKEMMEELQNEISADAIDHFNWAAGAVIAGLNESTDKSFVTELVNFSAAMASGIEDDDLKVHACSGFAFLCSQTSRFFTYDDNLLYISLKFIIEFFEAANSKLNVAAVQALQLLSRTCRDQLLKQPTEEDPSIFHILISNLGPIVTSLVGEGSVRLISVVSGLADAVPNRELKSEAISIILGLATERLTAAAGAADPDSTDASREVVIAFEMASAANTLNSSFYEALSEYVPTAVEIYNGYANFTGSVAQASSEGNEDAINAMRSKQFALAMQVQDAATTFLTRIINRTPQGGYDEINGVIFDLFGTFNNIHPDGRAPGLLATMGYLAERQSSSFNALSQHFFEAVFDPITSIFGDGNFTDFEPLRIPIFKMLRSILSSCTGFLSNSSEEAVTTLLGFIKFGCEHPQQRISEESHHVLNAFITAVVKCGDDFCNPFFGATGTELVAFVFQIMTDLVHKYMFSNQVDIICNLFAINAIFELRAGILDELIGAFPNTNPQYLGELIEGLYQSAKERHSVEQMLSDFLTNTRCIRKTDPALHKRQKEEAQEKIRAALKDVSGITPDVNPDEDI